MTKGNKIRIILWGIVWLAVLVATIMGIYAYYNGYGEAGKIRTELKPIVETFNNLNELNTYNNAGIKIKSSITKKGIKVNYKTNYTNVAYLFEYKKSNDLKLLYMKYNETSEKTANIIIKEMLEAISVLNNQDEGAIFNKISFDDLYNLSLNEGISLKYSNGFIEIYIDINKSVADYVTDSDKKYITENDLANMNNMLNINNKYNYSKSDITIYIESNEENYTLYAQSTNYNDYLYKSIYNVINTLDIKDANKDDFQISYPSISTSKEFGNYIITVDSDNPNNEIFKTNTNIIKIEIKKDI